MFWRVFRYAPQTIAPPEETRGIGDIAAQCAKLWAAYRGGLGLLVTPYLSELNELFGPGQKPCGLVKIGLDSGAVRNLWPAFQTDQAV